MTNNFIRRFIRSFGFDIIRYQEGIKISTDFDEQFQQTIRMVQPYTMQSPERLNGLCEAIRYIINNDIEGDIVECGVWRGGGMLAASHTLMQLKNTSKDIYLYDTFDGMPPPDEHDFDHSGVSAKDLLEQSDKNDSTSVWCFADLKDVKNTMSLTDYPKSQIHYIEGKVEDTIPNTVPEKISLLRLDTDWYQSTRHELIHLFPKISQGGILIIDDYGHWEGAKAAVDEYLQENNLQIFLNRLDYTGRIAVVQ